MFMFEFGVKFHRNIHVKDKETNLKNSKQSDQLFLKIFLVFYFKSYIQIA